MSPYQIQTTYPIPNTERLYCYYTTNTKPWEKQHTYYTSYQIQKKIILLHQIQNIAAPLQGPMPNTGHSMQHDTDRTLQHPNMSISVQESAPHSCSCLLIQCCTLIMCQWYEWNAITGLHCIWSGQAFDSLCKPSTSLNRHWIGSLPR